MPEDETAAPSDDSVEAAKPPKPSADTSNRFKQAWQWLRAKPWRLWTAIAALVVLVSSGVIAATDLRYPVAGLVLRSNADVTVTDSKTKQPVPKALVELGGQTQFTDTKGIAQFHKLKPGHLPLKITKAAYDTHTATQTVGLFGFTNASVALKSNGIKLIAQVKDAIGQGVLGAVEVSVGEASALTDSSGQVELSLPANLNSTTQTIIFEKDGFNKRQLQTRIVVGAPALQATLVPSGKVYFLSNRAGRIDLYGANLDGSDVTLALAGTGKEDGNTGVLPSTKSPYQLALVSTREGRRDQYGNIVSDLFLFNAQTSDLKKLDNGVSFNNYRAWVGDTLVYERYPDNECADIKTYNAATGKSGTLISSDPNNCAGLKAATNDGVFYSIRSTGKKGTYFAKIGGSTNQVSDTPADTVYRKARKTLLATYYSGPVPPYSIWQQIDIPSLTSTKLPNSPTDTDNYGFADSLSGRYSAFIEERDGRKELYILDVDQNSTEKKLTNMGAVNQFVQWYGDEYIAFSSTKNDENALYIVAVSGGQPVKITDFYRGNSHTYGGGNNPSYY